MENMITAYHAHLFCLLVGGRYITVRSCVWQHPSFFFHARMCTYAWSVHSWERKRGPQALSTRVDLHCWKNRIAEPSVPRSVHILSSRESGRVTNFMLVLAALHHGLNGFLLPVWIIQRWQQLEFNWRATPGMSNEHSCISAVINFAKFYKILSGALKQRVQNFENVFRFLTLWISLILLLRHRIRIYISEMLEFFLYNIQISII